MPFVCLFPIRSEIALTPDIPKRIKISGRISSITNAFVNSVIPRIPPSADEIAQALSILGMSPSNVRCAYCDDPATEWDHLMPLIDGKKPTGYITEIYNLIPACGKCNQSKGSTSWRTWINGSAPRSPASRGIANLPARIERIDQYEKWTAVRRRRIDIPTVAGTFWEEHERDRQDIEDKMRRAEKRAEPIRELLKAYYDGHTGG